jgi:hypothetical protein
MILMIYIKWLRNWDNISKPPSIISNMINMAINQGTLNGEEPLWGDKAGQEKLQLNLLLMAMLMIPMMFIPMACLKVCGRNCCRKKKK